MPANYNKIAPVYDLLSRLVFGKAIVNAQRSLLAGLPPGEHRLLIVGGGTGWILDELGKQRPEGITVDYVEVSDKMISLSKKRNWGANSVNFFCVPIENFESAYQYQAVITPFVLDNFEAPKLQQVFNKINALVADKGVWLYADFVYDRKKSPFWQKAMLGIMYFFFRITTNIEADKLVDTEKYFTPCYRKEMEAWFYFDFIKAIRYEKT